MKKQWIILTVVLVSVIALMLAVSLYFLPTIFGGVKNITVTVVHSDGQSKDFSYRTDEECLGPVLLDEGLVEGEQGPHGLYIQVVDGEQAIYEVDNAYWSLYVGDSESFYGADETAIQDGGVYKLVYTGA